MTLKATLKITALEKLRQVKATSRDFAYAPPVMDEAMWHGLQLLHDEGVVSRTVAGKYWLNAETDNYPEEK